MSFKKYKTKPFDCWQMCKELREQYIKDVCEANEKGKLVIFNNSEHMWSLAAGLGDHVTLHTATYDIALISNPEVGQQCFEALENRGYKDVCAYVALPLGSMLINRGPLGGRAVRPDLCLTQHVCEPMAKTSQLVSELFGIPRFTVDCPQVPRERLKEFHRQYLISQMYDAIEWMEKVTGRKYDDERLIEAVRNEWEICVLWAKIFDLNKAIPAPMDERSMLAFSGPCVTQRTKKKTVLFYRVLLNEMQDRVRNQIAAVGTERFRLLHEAGTPPWHFLRLFRMAEEYGVVFLGGGVMLEFTGAVLVTGDGSRIPAQSLEERGIELKTREDALGALADLCLYNLIGGSTYTFHTGWRTRSRWSKTGMPMVLFSTSTAAVRACQQVCLKPG
jgi:benzoyl-CoA reductase subunit B